MSMDYEIRDMWNEFLTRYYKEDIAKIAQKPNDNQSLWIDYKDLWKYDQKLADDLRTNPYDLLNSLEEEIPMVDIPLDVDLSFVTPRIYNLPEEVTIAPGEIRKEHGGTFQAIHGVLERVTSTSDMPEVLVFNCQRCDSGYEEVPQDPTQNDIQEPHQCMSCERQGPFQIDEQASEWSDYAKIRITARPSSDHEGKITGYVKNDLIDAGGEGGLMSRNGEPVTISGIVKRVQKTGRGENQLLFDHHLEVNSIEFDRDEETVNIKEHQETFEELASQPDAVDQFADSIAPHLHATDAWDAAFEFAVAYLFGAPRIDIQNGPTYRGDLHFLIVSDYGMGKSDFSNDIAEYSPKCIQKSTTALSSGVGLTAAAVKDDFGDGQWTLKPGLLVRANQGHLILDEIDKGPDELTEMNDALEGRQTVDVEKAGKSATYESRTGLMALGNPVDGRFDPNQKVSEQLGISESLLSRFDGIVTMRDTEDTETDAKIAESYGRAYTEAQDIEYGEAEDMDYLDRPVPIDVGQAWIKYAKENVNPLLRYEQFEELKDWYAEEVRQLNNQLSEEDTEDMPVPATVRVLGAAVKMSIAFARVRLNEEVGEQEVKRAKRLTKKLVKQNWDGEKFNANKESSSQQGRVDTILTECGGETLNVSEIAERTRMSYDQVRSTVNSMNESKKVANGKYEIPEVHK